MCTDVRLARRALGIFPVAFVDGPMPLADGSPALCTTTDTERENI
jgi:hypothetical protein